MVNREIKSRKRAVKEEKEEIGNRRRYVGDQ